MGDQHRGIFLEDCCYSDEGQLLLDELDGLPAAEIELHAGRHQQGHVIDLRAALFDRDVQAVARIDAGGDGLIEAAIFRLGFPVEAKGDVIGRERGGGAQRESRDQQPGRAPHPDQPRPTNGIFVAMMVMNCTLASSGRLAM